MDWKDQKQSVDGSNPSGGVKSKRVKPRGLGIHGSRGELNPHRRRSAIQVEDRLYSFAIKRSACSSIRTEVTSRSRKSAHSATCSSQASASSASTRIQSSTEPCAWKRGRPCNLEREHPWQGTPCRNVVITGLERPMHQKIFKAVDADNQSQISEIPSACPNSSRPP